MNWTMSHSENIYQQQHFKLEVCVFHQTHGHSPAQMVFGRDMLMPVSADINWEEIKERKQERIRKSNQRENSKRIPHKYKKGDLYTQKDWNHSNTHVTMARSL
jgi:hypothetical protein